MLLKRIYKEKEQFFSNTGKRPKQVIVTEAIEKAIRLELYPGICIDNPLSTFDGMELVVDKDCEADEIRFV